jgi:hypothetical protein
VLEIPVSLLFEGAPGSSPHESGMPQGVRLVAAFGRITDRKVRRSRKSVDFSGTCFGLSQLNSI